MRTLGVCAMSPFRRFMACDWLTWTLSTLINAVLVLATGFILYQGAHWQAAPPESTGPAPHAVSSGKD